MDIIKRFMEQENTQFDVFNEFMATRVLHGAFLSIARALHLKMKTDGKDEVSIDVPWGTFTASRRYRNGSDSASTNVSYVPPKAFLEALSGDSKDREAYYQEEFDDVLMDAFSTYVQYGMFDIESPEAKEKLVTAPKGIKFRTGESNYLMNRIATLLIGIGKEKQRDGKEYALELTDDFGHGTYYFDYDDDKVSVRFVADKPLKQAVKDDDAADNDE